MAYVIIQKKDKQKMADMVEDILYTAGRLMHCVEEMRDEDGYGDRYDGRYGMRYGDRDHDWDDMNERRYRRRY